MGYGGGPWTKAVQADPDVIDYTLQSITHLLDARHFPNDPDIAQRRAALDDFLQHAYCGLLPGGCGSLPDLNARWQQLPRLSAPLALHGATATATVITDPSGGNFTSRVNVFGGVAPPPPTSRGTASAAIATASAGARTSSGAGADASAATPVYPIPSFYDPVAGAWAYSSSPELVDGGSVQLVRSAAAVLDGASVITGGNLGASSGVSSATVVQLETATGEWKNARSMNTARGSHCAVVASDGNLYVIGGLLVTAASTTVLPSVEQYNKDTNLWSAVNSMPTARYTHGCSAHPTNGLVYVIGGLDAASALVQQVDVFDTASGQWVTDPSKLPPALSGINNPRYGHAQVPLGDTILVMGGFQSTGAGAVALGDVRVLDLVANTWTSGCPLVTPVGFAAVAVIQGYEFFSNATEVHLVGGLTTTSASTPAHQIFVIPPNATIVCAVAPALDTQDSGQAGNTIMRPTLHGRVSRRDGALFAPPVLSREGLHELDRRMVRAAVAHGAVRFGPARLLEGTELQPTTSMLGAGISTITGELSGTSVFEPLCADCFNGSASLNGRGLPDGVAVNSVQECSYHATSATTHDRADVSLQASAFFKLAAHIGFPFLFSFSFSAYAHASAKARAVFDYNAVLVDTTARCTAFQLGYGDIAYSNAYTSAAMPHVPVLSTDFMQAVLDAPAVFDPANPEPHVQILRHFGDAVVLAHTSGARADMSFHMSETDYALSLTAHFDAGYHSSHSFLFFWGHSHSEGATADVHADAGFRKYVQSNHTSCRPLCPPPVSHGTANSSAWHQLVGSQVAGQGAPMQYVVAPITALINIFTFRNPFIGAHLKSVRTILHQLMANGTFCELTPGCFSAQHAPRWAGIVACPPTGCAAGTVAVAAGEQLFLVGTTGELTSLALATALASVAPKWHYRAQNQPSTLAGATAVATNTSVFVVVGGTSPVSVRLYSTTARRWSTLPPVPAAAASTAGQLPVTSANGTVMAFSKSGQTSCQVHRLDPAQGCQRHLGIWRPAPRHPGLPARGSSRRPRAGRVCCWRHHHCRGLLQRRDPVHACHGQL
eukprot:m.30191 g.30191  ORF g.30191 m.30191 type:complete len:1059 (-) comp9386_c1_seq1:1649-4825(-)